MSWFRNLFGGQRSAKVPHRTRAVGPVANLLDEAFIRRLERLTLEARSSLRGTPTGGEHASRQQMPMTVFSDHRPYSSGDDYRLVDWNAYARHEQIVVKLGETEQSIPVHLLLDLSKSMDWGTPNKLLVARQLVAALGTLALANHDRLRIVPFSNRLLPQYGPVQGKMRLLEMLQYLNALKPAAQTALGATLAAYARANERGGLLVLCSDLLAEPAEGLAAALRHLPAPRWQVLVLQLFDPAELKPALDGPLDLEDLETGTKIDLVIDEQALAIYRQNLETWQRGVADACGRFGATLARVQTDWPLEKQVVPYLRSRRILT
jgi:uncharacterized protein (DUF58 family)